MCDVETKVIGIVSRHFDVNKSELTRETLFVDDLNADSLDSLELVMIVESEFEMGIPDEVVEKLQSIGSMISYIEETEG